MSIEQKIAELKAKKLEQEKIVQEFVKVSTDNYVSERLKLIQACNHTDVSYIPDPSGNNDSYYECNLCGGIRQRGKWGFYS